MKTYAQMTMQDYHLCLTTRLHKLEQVDSNGQMQQQADCIILCRLKWMLKHFIASSLHSSNTFDYVISRASPE